MRKVIPLMLIVAALALNAPAADISLVGVWKLNPPKSHFSHGDLPLSLVLTITSDGAGGIQNGAGDGGDVGLGSVVRGRGICRPRGRVYAAVGRF